MTIEGVTYTVRSKWAADLELAATVGKRFLAFLDGLQSLDRAMANWLMVDMVDLTAIRLTDVRADFTMFVERNATEIEGQAASDPRNGFTLLASGAEIESEFGTSQTTHVSVTAGAQWNNEASFEIGSFQRFPDPALVTYPIYKGALVAMVSAFPCPYAWARYFIATETVWIPHADGGGASAMPGEDLLPFDGIWIAYLSAPLAAGLVPPPELFPERTTGGGLILSAVRDHIDPFNPEHVRRSVMLRDIMIKHAAKPNFRGVVYEGDYPPRVGPY